MIYFKPNGKIEMNEVNRKIAKQTEMRKLILDGNVKAFGGTRLEYAKAKVESFDKSLLSQQYDGSNWIRQKIYTITIIKLMRYIRLYEIT